MAGPVKVDLATPGSRLISPRGRQGSAHRRGAGSLARRRRAGLGVPRRLRLHAPRRRRPCRGAHQGRAAPRRRALSIGPRAVAPRNILSHLAGGSPRDHRRSVAARPGVRQPAAERAGGRGGGRHRVNRRGGRATAHRTWHLRHCPGRRSRGSRAALRAARDDTAKQARAARGQARCRAARRERRSRAARRGRALRGAARPEDGLPLIGPVPGHPRCHAASGNGITFSALAADLVTGLLDGKRDPILHLFAVDRA